MASDGGNIVNLSSFRKMSREEKKRAAKKQKDEQAAANRVRFGRTGAEKKIAKLDRERILQDHEGKRRDRTGEGNADGEDEDGGTSS
ncbi:DUF4169 family protein [Parvibaculum sp.]|uniref:DUF4169 family protein n=1 Tax=Parvibaculum sp. TaxID=2024848 RepID=UPI00272FAAA5|nr:DUF4169 family protein [Parvibaculum sp.]MDP1626995.1 DUF4169 family protein [Parvibaculum sp.]MDP2149789.1 DUF4169 family protein [Parvibaculum sp.]MDP3327233.1 DUF4169 family protein [Parvibaculum sp.]